MNSDYCYSIEMKRAIERHERGEVRVIPVILRPVHWQVAPLEKLQALPKDGKPITDWTTQDHGFRNVTEGIYKVVQQSHVNHLPNLSVGQAPPISPSPTLVVDHFQWWHEDQIVQLKHEVRNLTVLTLLNLAAEHAGEWVSYEEVRERAGRTTRQAMGDLAGFTQLIKRHFKQNVDGSWPVEVLFEKPVKYRMPPNIAEYWKKA